jgi:hypothetical protein
MRRLVGAAVLALQVAVLTPTAGAAAVGIHLGGVSADPQVFAAISQAHPGWVNVFMGWNGVELAKGQYNESLLQSYVREFAALPPGTKINVNVAGTPAWATPGGSADTRLPPANPQDYADFLHYVSGRFAGTVTSWEVWNEEDSTAWWLGDLPTYVGLLKAAYPAVKSADPRAAVVFGGTVGNDYQFLEAAYAAGAAGSFDAVGVHTDTGCATNSPYIFQRDPGTNRINRYSFLGYREVHASMVAHGDGAKPIYMTELGWSSSAAQCPTASKVGGVSPATQAAYMAQAFHCLAGDPYVAVGIWFELIDNGATDTPLNRFGLLSGNLSPKPAYETLKSIAQSGDQLTGACGNFNAPEITIVSPTANQSAPGALLIKVSATSPAGVSRISLYYDATHLIRNFTDSSHPATLSGTIDWQGAKLLTPGRHTLLVKAVDPQGNLSTQTISFVHGAASGGNVPVLGKTVSAAVVSGHVYVLLPGQGHISQSSTKGVGFVPLTAGRMLPVGSIFDTTGGVVRLTSAANARGATQSGDFGSGVFSVLQNRREHGVTELRLVIGRAALQSCTLRSTARTAAAKPLPKRVLNLLKASVKGHFRSRGRYSSATVRGTVWQTTDRCDGTLTHVTRGVVVVRDLRRRRNIVLRAGKSYLARP